jgi:PAS domain S-box-containing protein
VFLSGEKVGTYLQYGIRAMLFKLVLFLVLNSLFTFPSLSNTHTHQSEVGFTAIDSLINLLIGSVRIDKTEFEDISKRLEEEIQIGLDRKTQLEFFKEIGDTLFSLYRFEKAIFFYGREYQLLIEEGDPSTQIQPAIRLGVCYKNIGEFEEALDLFQHASKLAGREGDKLLLSGAYVNVAHINQIWKNYDEAYEYYRLSLELKKEINDKIGMAHVTKNIGNILLDRKDYESAFEMYNDALAIFENQNHSEGIAAVRVNLGILYMELNDFDLSLASLREATRIALDIGDENLMAHSYYNLGKNLFSSGKNDSVLFYLNESLELANSTNDIELILNANLLLSDYYKKYNSNDLALEYFGNYAALRDSIFSKRTNERLSVLQMKFEAMNKEKQINQLKLDAEINTRNLLIIGTVSILLFSIILFFMNQFKSSVNNKLQAKNSEIKDKNEQLEILNNQLKESQEKYKNIFNSVNDFIYFMKPNGKFIEVNDVVTQKLGYEKEEFLKLSAWEIVDEKYRNGIQDRINQVIEKGEFIFETEHLTKDGKSIPLEMNSISIEFMGEKTILSVARDIKERKETENILQKNNELLEKRVQERTVELRETNDDLKKEIDERKKIEVELSKSKEFLQNLVNSLPNPIFLKDEEHRWILLNKAFCEFVGHEHDELIGKSDYDFFPKEEADVFWEKDDLVIRENIYNENEEYITDSAGNRHVIVTRKARIMDEQNNRLLVGVISDITDRKNLEEELIELNDKLELRVEERTSELQKEISIRQRAEEELIRNNSFLIAQSDSSVDGILIVDESGNVINFNNRFLEIWSLDKSTIKSFNMEKLVHYLSAQTADSTAFQDRLGLLKSNNEEILHSEIELSKGTILELYTGPIHSEEGKFFGRIWNFRDITDRKQTEQDLIKAKETAERSNKLKSEFLAQMSHEIRTPINIILNFSDLIKDELKNNVTKELHESFEVIETAGNRIARTIDMILNMSEIQTGNFEYKPKKIKLYDDLLYNFTFEFENFAVEKNIDFKIENHAPNTEVYADEFSLTQIFQNLIDNAIKYTENGKVRVHIDSDYNGKLIVKIADTGIGISPEYIPYLFEPFSQEYQGYSRKFEGNGLGLALVKKYCELNEIDITVESEKDVGTIFRLEFVV